jgi:hypothetical protein
MNEVAKLISTLLAKKTHHGLVSDGLGHWRIEKGNHFISFTINGSTIDFKSMAIQLTDRNTRGHHRYDVNAHLPQIDLADPKSLQQIDEILNEFNAKCKRTQSPKCSSKS